MSELKGIAKWVDSIFSCLGPAFKPLKKGDFCYSRIAYQVYNDEMPENLAQYLGEEWIEQQLDNHRGVLLEDARKWTGIQKKSVKALNPKGEIIDLEVFFLTKEY